MEDRLATVEFLGEICISTVRFHVFHTNQVDVSSTETRWLFLSAVAGIVQALNPLQALKKKIYSNRSCKVTNPLIS